MVLGLGKIAKILEKSKNVRTLIMALIRMDNIFILLQVGAKSIRRVAALNDHPTFIKVRNFSCRPQTKFAKVMFSQCLSVHGGGMGVCPGRGGLRQGDPPRTVKSGRYASYWNAFFFKCLLSYIQGATAQGKQGIWFLLCPDDGKHRDVLPRENIWGGLARSEETQMLCVPIFVR